MLGQIRLVDQWNSNVGPEFGKTEIVHVLVFHHIADVDVLVFYLDCSILCGNRVIQGQRESSRSDSFIKG